MELKEIDKIAVHKLFPLYRRKKLLLIRPRKPGDDYTELGSYDWAGLVKQRALDLGWAVTDLAINDATRENVESKIEEIKPTLIMHYDHGGTFTLWGQESNTLEPVIDSANVGLLANRVVSTVSCSSASGLGPLAIADGATSYLGYDEPHGFVIGYQDRFGEASNAANYALLACKSIEEAYQAGIDAYDDLYDDLMSTGDFFAADWVLHDRDCFVMLGSSNSNACPATLVDLCMKLPNMEIICKKGPNFIDKCAAGPYMFDKCAAGPYMFDKCAAGPSIEIIPENIPREFKKPLMQLLERMRMEQ
jgi:hypothetical protein